MWAEILILDNVANANMVKIPVMVKGSDLLGLYDRHKDVGTQSRILGFSKGEILDGGENYPPERALDIPSWP